MVAFKGAKAQSVAARPPDQIVALLIYGPNAGLVRERARSAVAYAVEDLGDGFRLCELQAKEVKDDPARLADEMGALSFAGGRRAVWLRDATDELGEIIASALETEFGDTLLVVEAGNLTPRSGLRKLFEEADNLGAVPCYDDDAGSLRDYVSDFLASRNATIESDALYWLIDRLGNDRLQVRNELEKLALYAAGDGAADDDLSGAEGSSAKGTGDLSTGHGGATRISLESVMAVSGDAGVWSLGRLAEAVASGELAEIDRTLQLAYEEGNQPIAALRGVARRFEQLHLVVGSAGGGGIDKAMGALRPPIFFKERDAFRSQAMNWSLPRIAQALDILNTAEIDCKTTGMPAEEICARALIRIGAAARAGRR
jgi:DNA polymerase-3 subunit delta